LVIADGSRIGMWEESNLFGGVLVVRDGKMELKWREEFKDRTDIDQLLQAGPRLVSDSQALTGFRNDRETRRTFIATDDEKSWVLGICTKAKLSDLADMLVDTDVIPEFNVVKALNLDGGNSSGLWLKKPDGKALYFEEQVPVRNMLLVEPR
jgi:exopolysaccharide biosynthesis protein